MRVAQTCGIGTIRHMKYLFLLLLPIAAFATDKPVNSPPQSQQQSQAQEQSQSQDQTITVDNYAQTIVKQKLQIPDTPAPTAPAIYASNPCALGESSAVTMPVFGRAKGKAVVDAGCEFRELVRVTASVDPCLARKLLATHPAIAALNPEPIECVSTSALVELEQRVTDKIGTAFKQSQSK